jgi:PHP family Zn ribbon phosphoesterase
LSPKESKKLNNICPVCNKPLTIGVAHRVEDLADRSEDYIPKDKIPFKNLVPLEEIIAQALNKDVSSPFVQKEYLRIVSTLDNEINILMEVPLEDIKNVAGFKISEGVRLMREGKIKVEPGYDGVYGRVKIFPDDEKTQLSLF